MGRKPFSVLTYIVLLNLDGVKSDIIRKNWIGDDAPDCLEAIVPD